MPFARYAHLNAGPLYQMRGCSQDQARLSFWHHREKVQDKGIGLHFLPVMCRIVLQKSTRFRRIFEAESHSELVCDTTTMKSISSPQEDEPGRYFLVKE